MSRKHRIRVLLVCPTPEEAVVLRTDREERAVLESIRISEHRNTIRVTPLRAATVDDLRRELRRASYDIFHFSGHGTREGLIFEDESGRSIVSPPSAMARLLSRHGVEVAFLNTCNSFEIGKIAKHTVVVKGRLDDDTAIELSRGFYDALGAGATVSEAAEEGISSVELKGLGSPSVLCLSDSSEAMELFHDEKSENEDSRPEAQEVEREQVEAANEDERCAREWVALSNRAAAELFLEYVRGREVSSEFTEEDRRRLSGGYWTYRDYESQRNYVRARRAGSPELIQPKVCTLLRRCFLEGTPAHVWMIGKSGIGKTTTLYGIYFELAVAQYVAERENEPSLYPIPMLVQPQKIDADSIERLRKANLDHELPLELLKVWCERRGIAVPAQREAALAHSFTAALRNGDVVLLLDSYDELNRMSLQIDMLKRLIESAKYYICATRPEFFVEGRHQINLWIEEYWDAATIKDYLHDYLPDRPEWVAEVVRYISRRGREEWLRNPRYLNMLVELLRSEHLSGQSASRLLAQIENGQYSLLEHVYEACLERVKSTAIRAGRELPGNFDLTFRGRLTQIAKRQLTSGVTVLSQRDISESVVLSAIVDATELVKRSLHNQGEQSHLSLVSYNWVDFFLVDLLVEELLDPGRDLSLPHLWTQNLLTYMVEALCRRSRPSNFDSLYEEVRGNLEGCRLEPSVGEDTHAPTREENPMGFFHAVNLVHLLIEIKLHALLEERADEKRAGRAVETNEERRRAVRFEGEDFSGLFLDSVDLAGLHFKSCSFSRSHLTHAKLEGAVFEYCCFTGTRLSRARADFARFVYCDLGTAEEPQAVSKSRFENFSIQGTCFESHFDNQQERLLEAGAELQRSRYDSPFGREFFAKQQELLGGGLTRAEAEYLARIKRTLDRCVAEEGEKPLFLVDLMAGGGNKRLIQLLRSYENLHVLAVDREGSQMGEIADAFGKQFSLYEHEITGAFDLQGVLKANFGVERAHLVIGKKALHELERDAQVEVIETAVESLWDSGRLVFFLDSPKQISDTGFERLRRARAELRRLAQQPDLSRLRRVLIDELVLEGDEDDPAIFSNLWVALKDWAHRNEHELHHRYFSSFNEIESWVAAAGAELEGPAYIDSYLLSARIFNETGLNQVSMLLDREGGRLTSANLAMARAALEGDRRQELFCDFAEHHLWGHHRGNQPTTLGKMLSVLRAPISFQSLHTALRKEKLRLSYDSSVAFEFSVHVGTFRKT